MKQTITQYTDIRDELEDFLDFIQSLCYDIGDVVEEMDDQIDTLSDRLFTYNELAENLAFLSGGKPSAHSCPVSDFSAEEELPFPSDDIRETV